MTSPIQIPKQHSRKPEDEFSLKFSPNSPLFERRKLELCSSSGSFSSGGRNRSGSKTSLISEEEILIRKLSIVNEEGQTETIEERTERTVKFIRGLQEETTSTSTTVRKMKRRASLTLQNDQPVFILSASNLGSSETARIRQVMQRRASADVVRPVAGSFSDEA